MLSNLFWRFFFYILATIRTEHIRHLWRKTAVLSSHRCLNNSCVEIIKQQWNMHKKFNHQISLSKSLVFKQLFKFSKVHCFIVGNYCLSLILTVFDPICHFVYYYQLHKRPIPQSFLVPKQLNSFCSDNFLCFQ